MFYVEKDTLPTYWWFCNGHIEERIGDMPTDGYYYKTMQEAYYAAYSGLRERLIAEYQFINCLSPTALRILRIRSLWNAKIAAGLAVYQTKVEEARQACMKEHLDVKIERIPDLIPVSGQRLAIGTRVYEFDNHSLQLCVATVDSETICYYDFHPEGVPAFYTLSNGRSVKSTLDSGFSNIEYYLDSEEANTRMREAVGARIQELQEMLR